MTDLQHFVKNREYLVCVDSDGCAMDTMDIKHFRCFGPCMVEEWGLEEWAQPILARWNEINLYTMTRGVNRFKGLAMALDEINAQYTAIEGLDELKAWAASAPELSNGALEKALPAAQGPCLAKALSWSKKVNAAINALPESEKKPFDGAAAGLAAAHAAADVAVVSSANREAVEEEWARCGLLGSVDVLCCQDAGSKAACIAQLKAKGYSPDHILMVGDAPGDKAAAEKNGVWFYPILVRHEAESWAELVSTALARLTSGAYAPYGEALAEKFLANLGE
ncbi:MAG TPA: HAD family hydrolase [Candidatus Gemmiger stercoripullorum]|nr:HAD family hydrolase [Candidatus Gemmiger stercoripullorum]